MTCDITWMVASSQLMSLPLCQILSVFWIAIETPWWVQRLLQHYSRGVRDPRRARPMWGQPPEPALSEVEGAVRRTGGIGPPGGSMGGEMFRAEHNVECENVP